MKRKTSTPAVVSKPKARPSLTPEDELALIQKRLGHPAGESVENWLDLGNPLANYVFGSPTKGMPYGKIIELAGFESHGKTALAYWLAGQAQKDGASVALWDLELSWDPDWAEKRGLDPKKVIVFKPTMGIFGKEKEKRLITAEEHIDQIEMWVAMKRQNNPIGKLFLIVDSIAAINPSEAQEAGVHGNMRTKVSTASMLSTLLPQWQKMAYTSNCTILLINQIRVSPGVRFGNPEYTPGGNAIRFFAAVRLRMKRSGGKLVKNGKEIGIKVRIRNYKNKAGGDSKEHLACGFKLCYDGRSKFTSEKEVAYEKDAD